jgi:hypothetical protein
MYHRRLQWWLECVEQLRQQRGRPVSQPLVLSDQPLFQELYDVERVRVGACDAHKWGDKQTFIV